MKYFYAYKTSDGARHEDSMEAESREAVFESLRGQGIRPIKVVAADGAKSNGEIRGVRRRVVVVVATLCALVAAAAVYLLTTPKAVGPHAHAMTRRPIANFDSLVFSVRTPPIFTHPSETFLARYAIPGRIVDSARLVVDEALEEDFRSALDEVIPVSDGDAQEVLDLKGVVAGMKEELKMFLASGGTIAEYLLRLEERQKMEINYREQAAIKLQEAVNSGEEGAGFRVWKEQNAWLQAMGIERLPTP